MAALKKLLLQRRFTKRLLLSAATTLILFYVTWWWKLVLFESPQMDKTIAASGSLTLLHNTVSALERAIDHLFEIGEDINLDGVLGVRLVEAQLRALHEHVITPLDSRNQHHSLTSVIGQLNSVQEKSRRFRQIFTKIVKKNQPQYYQSMSFLIMAGSWELWHPQRAINRNLMPTYGFEKTVQETLTAETSDNCMKEPYVKQCQFTKKCWNQMNTFSRHGYSLTHEVFFILTSFLLGCGKEVEISAQKWNSMNSDEILDRQMAAMLHEAELIARSGFPPYQRDLFMEQIAFGGILGYRDFFREEWLQQILSWQDEKGCFLIDYNDTFAIFASDFPNHPNVLKPKKPERVSKPGRGLWRDSSVTSAQQRQKRHEIFLPDGCLAHMTAVGVAALGQNIRYLLESLLTN